MMREFRIAAAAIACGGAPELAPGIAEFVRSILDLDAALEMGFTVTLAEVTSLEFAALAVLRQERAKEQAQKQAIEAQRAASRQRSGGF